MTFLKPTDTPGTVYEFFAPFAHVEGRYEWCRIRSPTHGVFDVFILLGASTSDPATVYVSSDAGALFMQERYPACATFRVDGKDLVIRERDDGRTVEGELHAATGPVSCATMRFTAARDAPVSQVPYGGEGRPIWGNEARTCWGVDLVVRGRANGGVTWRDDTRGPEQLEDVPASITLGSFGRIAPR